MSATLRRLQTPIRAITILLMFAAVPAGALEYSPEERLILAADQGDQAAVNALLKSGVDVNYQISPGRTAMTVAVGKGDLAMVQLLLAAKADPDVGGKSGNSALYAAAGGGRWEIVLALLAAKAKADFKDSSGYTPLFFAAQSGREDVVKALVAAGADPSPRVKAGGGRSAVYWVMMSGQLDMALLLVRLGANGNEATDYQDTPLRLAASGSSDKHLQLVRALLAAGVNTETGQVPRFKLESSCLSADSDPVCLTGIREAPGTALGIAANSGSLEIVQALIGAKAYVDARQNGNRTPLMIAAASTGGSPPIISLFGAKTPAPVFRGRADVVRALLAAGADVNAKDSSGKTALMLAEAKGHGEVVQILRAAAAPAANQ